MNFICLFFFLPEPQVLSRGKGLILSDGEGGEEGDMPWHHSDVHLHPYKDFLVVVFFFAIASFNADKHFVSPFD